MAMTKQNPTVSYCGDCGSVMEMRGTKSVCPECDAPDNRPLAQPYYMARETPTGNPMPVYHAETIGGGWRLPRVENENQDYAVSVPAIAGLNSRTLYRISGAWWVQWPGFAARKADANYM